MLFIVQSMDDDLNRIKNQINYLNTMLTQGTISMFIKLFVSWMVTLEITNGIEKITIQEILTEVKNRINELNKNFDELCFTITTYNEKISDETADKINVAKSDFRKKVYKLFDLYDIFHIMVEKCATTGTKHLMPYIKVYIDPLTITVVDSLLFTETDSDFENKLYLCVTERMATISDPSKRKIAKINILHNVLKMIINDDTKNSGIKNNFENDDMIGMVEITK